MLKSKSSNTIQAVWVAIGTLSSFVFSIATAAILSRFFDKNEYGTYKQVLYIYNTLLIIFTLGLPRAFSYFLSRVDKSQGKDIVKKITLLFYIMGAVIALMLYTCAPLIANVLNNSNLVTAIRIFAPVPFFMLPTMGVESIYSTYKKTYIYSIFVVLSRLFMLSCVALPVVFFQGSYQMALTGFLISSILVYLIAIYLKSRPFRFYSRTDSGYSYKDILAYTLPLFYAGIFGCIIASSDQFFISRYFGTEEFAIYSNGAMELPLVGMIIGACSIVLTPVFSKFAYEHKNPKELIIPLWNRVLYKTTLLIYPMVVFCWFYADSIMELLYGYQYTTSSNYFRITLIANLFTLAVYGSLLLSLGKTKLFASIHFWGMLAVIIFEYMSIITISSPYVIVGISVSCNIIRIFAMLYFIARYFRIGMLSFLPIKLMLQILVPSAIILYVIRSFIYLDNPFLNIILGGTIYMAIYLTYTLFLKINYLHLIKPPKK